MESLPGPWGPSMSWKISITSHLSSFAHRAWSGAGFLGSLAGLLEMEVTKFTSPSPPSGCRHPRSLLTGWHPCASGNPSHPPHSLRSCFLRSFFPASHHPEAFYSDRSRDLKYTYKGIHTMKGKQEGEVIHLLSYSLKKITKECSLCSLQKWQEFKWTEKVQKYPVTTSSEDSQLCLFSTFFLHGDPYSSLPYYL